MRGKINKTSVSPSSCPKVILKFTWSRTTKRERECNFLFFCVCGAKCTVHWEDGVTFPKCVSMARRQRRVGGSRTAHPWISSDSSFNPAPKILLGARPRWRLKLRETWWIYTRNTGVYNAPITALCIKVQLFTAVDVKWDLNRCHHGPPNRRWSRLCVPYGCWLMFSHRSLTTWTIMAAATLGHHFVK